MFGAIEVPDSLLPGATIPRGVHSPATDDAVPATQINEKDLVDNDLVIDLFTRTGLCSSKSDARRLVLQGGAYVDGNRVSGVDQRN